MKNIRLEPSPICFGDERRLHFSLNSGRGISIDLSKIFSATSIVGEIIRKWYDEEKARQAQEVEWSKDLRKRIRHGLCLSGKCTTITHDLMSDGGSSVTLDGVDLEELTKNIEKIILDESLRICQQEVQKAIDVAEKKFAETVKARTVLSTETKRKLRYLHDVATLYRAELNRKGRFADCKYHPDESMNSLNDAIRWAEVTIQEDGKSFMQDKDERALVEKLDKFIAELESWKKGVKK